VNNHPIFLNPLKDPNVEGMNFRLRVFQIHSPFNIHSHPANVTGGEPPAIAWGLIPWGSAQAGCFKARVVLGILGGKVANKATEKAREIWKIFPCFQCSLPWHAIFQAVRTPKFFLAEKVLDISKR
jgi:hypothetical protein